MTDVRRYGMVLLTICIVLSWTTGALAAKCFLLYDDGRVVETRAESEDDIEEEPSADRGRVVTLDVWQEIKDNATMEPVSEVYPGQRVVLCCHFNRLGLLEVPFEQLIGREITAYFTFLGALKYKFNWSLTIEPDDRFLVGMGDNYTVPDDAPAGRFLYFTRAKISGLWARNGWDWGIYSVVE